MQPVLQVLKAYRAKPENKVLLDRPGQKGILVIPERQARLDRLGHKESKAQQDRLALRAYRVL